MIKTSYFAKFNGDNGVSIATNTPWWFKGEIYPELAPPKWLMVKYNKKEITDEDYEALYNYHVLRKLMPLKVYNDLNEKVLLGYKESGQFCHRRVVARWLKKRLGVTIKEIDYPEEGDKDDDEVSREA